MGFAIEVEGVSKSYDSKTNAVDNVSFNIEEGEVVSILGESGSGKSTLLRLLAGLEDADTGDISICDEEITGPANNLVPGYDFITLVFQNFKLQRFKTIEDNIASEVYYLSENERQARVKELLILCRLTDKADNFPNELSGGQQQRVAIAIALAKEPSVVLMDEPFSSLDSRLKGLIRQEVVGILREAGVTVVMVSHDHMDAMSVADRIMVVQKGEVVQMGTPEDLYYTPVSEYAANFLGPINYIRHKGSRQQHKGVRPEKIRITAFGMYKGKVTRSVFLGMHFHIYVQSDISDKEILIYSDERKHIGSMVAFEVS